jgi:Cu(I)/Ag(I) efflux system membrane fusion protein
MLVWSCSSTGNSRKDASTKAESHAVLTVQGACGMCKERIEKTALAVKGVTSAVWNRDTKELHLNLDSGQTSVSAVSVAVAKVGHDTPLNKAPDEVYNALPGCCKYR